MIMLVNLPSKQPGKLVEQTLRAKQEKNLKLTFWRQTSDFSRVFGPGFLCSKLDLGRVSLHG